MAWPSGSNRTGMLYVYIPFPAETDEKHPFKHQLHTIHVVAVGWGQHGCSPMACVWGGGSAFLPIGEPVNSRQQLNK